MSQPTRSEQTTAAAGRQGVLKRGREVLKDEISALEWLAGNLDGSFIEAVEMLSSNDGKVVVTGMGKAGIVGKKIAASLSSTGTPSYFLHPSEALHGDVGSVREHDIVLFLSYSGETPETCRLLACLKAGVFRHKSKKTLAITAHPQSTLAKGVDLVVSMGQHREACSIGLAPSVTTTAMLALGDALTLVVSENRGFTRDQFSKYHPAGSLGKQLTRVDDVMRPLDQCRVAPEQQTVRRVLIQAGKPGRRTGAIMLCNDFGRLTGIFTDSDLARMMETSDEMKLDRPIAEVMTKNFQTIACDIFLPEAMQRLAQRKISELPVVTDDFVPLGILDITDVMAFMSDEWCNPNANERQSQQLPFEKLEPHMLRISKAG